VGQPRYDSFGRLSAANCSGNAYCPAANGGPVDYTYAYDRYGNRWQQKPTSGTGITELLTFNSNNQVASNAYDPLGNVTSDGTYTYTYDAENRPITVSGGTSYAYDAFGRRVYRQTTAGTREYTFDLQGNVLNMIISGSIGPAYISIAGRPWGQIPTSNGSTWFMHTDWLGSTRAYTTLSGSLQGTCQALPFGDGRNCTAGSDDDYYAGSLWWNSDDASYLSQTRSYNPVQAHWATTDPGGLAVADATDPQTWNRYAYVMNNPAGYIDPTGLACYPLEKAMFGSCAGFMNNDADVSVDGVDTPVWLANAMATAGGLVAFPVNCTYVGCQTSRGFVPINQLDNGQFGGCGQSDSLSFFWMEFASTPLDAANNGPSWWGAFGKSLFSWKNFSAGFKPGGCFAQFAEEAFDPAADIAGQDAAIKATAQSGAYVAATAYAARQGLVVPMRSSIVRGILDVGEVAGEAITLGATIYSEGTALVNEVKSFQSGQCQ
jgi:RHS repeat-associated protein